MANQSLSQLAAYLQTLVSDGHLVMDVSSIQGSDNYGLVFPLLGVTDLTITVGGSGISYDDPTQTLTITGSSILYGLDVPSITITMKGADVPSANCILQTSFPGFPLSTLITSGLINSASVTTEALALFTVGNATLAITAPAPTPDAAGIYLLTAAGSPNSVVPLVAALDISLTSPALVFTRTTTGEGLIDPSLVLKGKINVGGLSLDTSLIAPVSTMSIDDWEISFSPESGKQALSLSNLVGLLPGNNPFTLLPPSFSVLGDLTLQSLSVTFDFTNPTSPDVSDVAINISTGSGDWNVMSDPKFTITSIGCLIDLSRPLDPGSDATVTFTGGFKIGTEVTLATTMSIDITTGDWMANISGDLQKKGLNDLFGALPQSSGGPAPALPAGFDVTTISLNSLSIFYNASASSNKVSLISFNISSNNLVVTIIPSVLAAANPFASFNIANPGSSTNMQVTGTAGCTLMIGTVPFAMTASRPAPASGWIFEASMDPNNPIDLDDLVTTFMNNALQVSLPAWVGGALPTITALDATITMPPTGANTYAISGKATWANFKCGSITVDGTTCTIDAKYDGTNLSGSILAGTTLGGHLSVQVGFSFVPGANKNTKDEDKVMIQLGDAVGTYDSTSDIITISFTNTTLGGIINNLMESVDPQFQLSFPWTFLNDINLAGLSMTIGLAGATSPGVTLTYTSAIDLGFLKINSFTITKTPKTGVQLAIDGTFLGLSTTDSHSPFNKPQPMTNLPPVPGHGNSYFNLSLLAVGQRVGLQNPSKFNHVSDVIGALANVKAPDGTSIPLQSGYPTYDPNSGWLVAASFGILQIPTTTTYSILADVVFNDPNIYGLQLSLNGDKMKFLSGLKFEIMYKKVSDTIGVYQLDLTLPPSVRNLDFGEFNIIIPSIGLQIYTNGNFMVDVGFPYNADFSQSFTINALIWVGPAPVPVLGSAGFYFGMLSSATCPQVPQTKLGTFNPVIAFGVGAQLGLGYSFNKGVLSAGFSLTVLAILEGIIATWQPYAVTAEKPNDTTSLSTSHYFLLKGTFGIAGKLWGSIDFAIIKASLDIAIIVTVSTTYESFKPMPLSFSLTVSVTLSVKINLWIFSFTIHFSFNLTLNENLTIGSDHSADAPWNQSSPTTLRLLQSNIVKRIAPGTRLKMVALPQGEAAPTTINIYFAPHLTVLGDETAALTSQTAEYVAMLYIDTIPDGQTPNGSTSFEKLAIGVFQWVLRSYLPAGATTVTVSNLTELRTHLGNTAAAFTANDVMNFLQANFILNIQVPASQNSGPVSLDVTVFPMVPTLGLSVAAYGDAPAVSVDFASFAQCDPQYVQSVQDYFAGMTITGSGIDTLVTDSTSVSAASIIFADYFQVIARNLVHAAEEIAKDYKYSPSANDTLLSIVQAFTSSTSISAPGLTVLALAEANNAAVLGNVQLRIFNVQHTIVAGDTFISLAVQFGLPISQLLSQNKISAGIIAPGVKVSYSGTTYQTAAGDNLAEIGGQLNAAPDVLGGNGTSMISQSGLISPGITITAGTTNYLTVQGDTFSTIAQKFNLVPSALAQQNESVAQLLTVGCVVFYNGLLYTIQRGDTLASIAARFSTTVAVLVAIDNEIVSNASVLAPGGLMMIAGAQRTVQATDTLSFIYNIYNPLSATTMSAMLSQNQFLPNLVLPGVAIVVAGQPTYTTQPGDTIGSIFNAFPTTTVDSLASALQNITSLFKPQTPFYIPPMTCTPGGNTNTLQSIAASFQTTIDQIIACSSNITAAGIFPTAPAIIIPGVQSFTIDELGILLQAGDSITQSSGMVSRFLLHGLRLPINQHITFKDGTPSGSSVDCALYLATGQQFILPSSFNSTPYTIELTNAAPGNGIQFNGSATESLPVLLGESDQAMIASVLSFARGTGVTPVITSLSELSPYQESGANFIFRASVPITPGAAMSLSVGGAVPLSTTPHIWPFPSGIIQAVNDTRTIPPMMLPFLSKGGDDIQHATAVGTYAWSTLLNVTVRKTVGAPPFCYEIVGADEVGTQLLQNLLYFSNGADNGMIFEIDVLYTANASGSYASDGNANIISFILQSNLSTVTNPPQSAGLRIDEVSAQEAFSGILNPYYEFLRLLWECSVTRSGGFFLYYNVPGAGTGLPDQLFKGSETAVINILVQYKNPITTTAANQLFDFMNALVTAVAPFDSSKDVVFAQSQLQQQNYTVAAGPNGAVNSIAIADITALYNVLPSDLLSENPTAVFNPNLQLQIPAVYYQMKIDDTFASVATMFSQGALNPITASQLMSQNIGVTPGPWTLLSIGNITLVTGTGGPPNTVGGVLNYYGLSAEAFAVANESLQGLFVNNTVLSISDQIVTRSSVVPQGSAGYKMTRQIPGEVPASATDQNYPYLYLQNAYNQAVAALVQTNALLPVTPGRPVGPISSEGLWQYSQAVPVCNYVRNRGMVNVPDMPQDDANPYAGVGTIVQLNLDWTDLFGNHTVTPFSNPQLPNGTIMNNIPLQLGYTDNVIPISSWPGVTTYYIVKKDPSNNPELQIGLLFDSTIYDPTKSATAKDSATHAVAAYASIYYQLCQVTDPTSPTSTVSVQVDSSLLNAPYPFTEGQFNSLLTFVEQVYGYLLPVAGLSSPFVPLPSTSLEVDFLIPLSLASAPVQPIFELSVTITILRQLSQVHDDFKDIASVLQATSVVSVPSMPNLSEIVDLVSFANTFEAAMDTGTWCLKIATGMPDLSGATAKNQSIWAVQWGDQSTQPLSMAITNTPVYYAVPPLANSVLSAAAVPLYDYTTGAGLSSTPTQTVAMTGVNMDTWALACLGAIETMLSPQYAAPMFMLDQVGTTTYLNQLLTSKQQLAVAIAAKTVNILGANAPPAEAVADAVEQMHQQALSSLTNVYTLNSIIQFPTAVAAAPPAAGTIAPNLFGQAVTSNVASADDTTQKNYTLSTAKVPLGTASSYLSFVCSVNKPGDQTSLSFNIAYQPTHLEHDIEKIPGVDGYQGSSWLNFVAPPAPFPIGPIDVPVLLKAYPIPPSILNQWGTYDKDSVTIAQFRQWNYGFTYSSIDQAQDYVQARVDFNLQPVPSTKMLDDTANLLYALAQFNNVYDLILQDINKYFPLINPGTKKTDTVCINAQAAAAAFNTLIANVVAAWTPWTEVLNKLAPLNQQGEVSFEFNIQEAPQNQGDDTSPLVVSLTSSAAPPAGLQWPTITIDQYKTVDGVAPNSFEFTAGNTYFQYKDAQKVNQRSVAFPPLDIISLQDALAGVSITRNAVLAGQPTNPDFIYQTPFITFSSMVVPLVDAITPISIDALNPLGQPVSLSQHLVNLLIAVFGGDIASSEKVKLSCSYSYNAKPLTGFAPLIVPVLLATPFNLSVPADYTLPPAGCQATPPSGVFACVLAKAIVDWFQSSNPERAGGILTFDFAVYSKVDPTNQLPVVQFRNLTLNIMQVTELLS